MGRLTLRIWILIIVLIFALLAISPSFQTGALIKSVEKNTTYFNDGLRAGMVITSINEQEVKNSEDYSKIILSVFPVENETKLIIQTKERSFIFYTNETPLILVSNLPSSKIKTGLDLSGGARALVKPEKPLTASEMSDLVAVTSNRLNVFGIADVTVKPVSDLEGNNFMMVEVAGASPADLQELVGKQGKFEAKIGNETVFIGGERDITYVAKTGQEAGVESCFQVEEGYACRFRFAVHLSPEAAKRHADITSKLGVNTTDGGRYLDKKLDMYVDDQLVDSLLISEELKGKETTQISVQGSGTGASQQDALKAATESMRKLQTVLITGSLPYKLEIVKLDTISPTLGKEFTKNLIILAIVVFAIVSIVIFIRYRRIKITLSVILTLFSEAFITLGIAALISWNLDAPSIAGIIAGMGTGVNDQIVLIDESVSNQRESMKERIKRAFFIITGAFFTIVAAMLPLFWAGAGMLKGFALTTILSVMVGILITRPAFADILKKIQKD
ncbi:MAG: protein translocase subunit SecD [Nanoarchaeota archaeon]|nr:protein translocase subunit SecD [Nanoarchaeota archaeon]MBU4086491.1 protein translocase subunit SecD [Nanoarchaeota archaeon]